MATCRSCQAEIEWAQTEKGAKKIPLDAHVDPTGNLRVVSRVATEFGMTPVVRYVPKGTGNRVSHFATCPDRDKHRQSR